MCLLAYVLPGLPAAALLAVMLWRHTRPDRAPTLVASVVAVAVLFGGLMLAARFVPERLGLPSEAGLVAWWNGPGRLGIIGERSFSAEFTAQGRITRLPTPGVFSNWAQPGDAVLVHGGLAMLI